MLTKVVISWSCSLLFPFHLAGIKMSLHNALCTCKHFHQVWLLDLPNVLCNIVSPHSVLCEKALTCRAKRSQDERDAEARRYHKDTSTLSVKVTPVKHISSL